MRVCLRTLPLLIFILFQVLGMIAEAQASAQLAGKLIQVQGQVSVRKAGGQVWEAGRLDQDLFEGDAVQTGVISRAAILCVDESQIKLNENTLFVLNSVAPSPRLGWGAAVPAAAAAAASLYQVPQGEIWLRNSNEKFRFEVETPALTAGIRGTEFNLKVAPDGLTVLALLTGSLLLKNPQGQVILSPGEEGLARPGEAPTKRVLVQPADAVQWSLAYPGIISYRDLPLTSGPTASRAPAGPPAAASLVRQAEASYDQGRLEQAREEAEQVLQMDKGNPRALTVLGWVSLQRQDPEAAAGWFHQVGFQDEAAVVGLALALYRQQEVVKAYDLMIQARHRLKPTPFLTTMTGYFALMSGQVVQARKLLEAVITQDPQNSLPYALLAQIALVQDRKKAAQKAADRAVALNPKSPAALVTLALVNLAHFDMKTARLNLERALAADPACLEAYIYLARIWLGSDFLYRAQRTIDIALKLAPREAEVLSMAGFIRLGFRDYKSAKDFFDQAVKANPNFGDPHLGLGQYYFRYRDFNRGLSEILTSTLLEPRVSLYQSFLGKAFYQMRAFDKALDTYDYAKTLDPKDPTPYLYKGIALSDLNRPGEAIIELNRSIELNDNRAVVRSRLGLTRDLAVRNYDLAYAYNSLGLGDWAYSKAITAVQLDPTNSSAQLFLAQAFVRSSQRVAAAGSAALLFKLLSPANQSTFAVPGYSLYGGGFQSTEYTPMFEMPYGRLAVSATGGIWDSRNQNIQDYFLKAYGGLPGVAGEVRAGFSQDQGFRRRNSGNRSRFLSGLFKWDATPKTSMFFQYSYQDSISGDDLFFNDYYYQNSPFYRYAHFWNNYEGGFVHRFTPNSIFLAYMNYQRHTVTNSDLTLMHSNLPYIDGPYPWFGGVYFNQGFLTIDNQLNSQNRTTLQIFNPQVQQMLILGKHTFLLGGEYYTAKGNFANRNLFTQWLRSFTAYTANFYDQGFNFLGSLPYNPPLFIPLNLTSISPSSTNFWFPEWSYSLYLLDYWRPTEKLLLELGATYEANKSTNTPISHTIARNLWSPRLGINYFITPQQVVRLGAYTALSSLSYQNSLLPSQVAGVPYDINGLLGTKIREAGASWEAQWTPKTFTVVKAGAIRVTNEAYLSDTTPREYLTWKEYYSTLRLNQILLPYLGLSLGGQWKRVQLYHSYPNAASFSELDGLAGLSFWHSSGIRANLGTTLIYQKPQNLKHDLFGTVDAGVGYEFPQKRGRIFLMVNNIFNRHFTYLLEPVGLATFFPSRRITLNLALYF